MKLLIDRKYWKRFFLSLAVLAFTGIYTVAEASWSTKIIGAGNYWIKDVTTDNQDNVYALGGFEDYLLIEGRKFKSENGRAIFFAKFNESGKLQWVKQFTGEGNIIPRKIINDEEGNIYMAVEYENTINIGENMLEASFATNMAIVKFNNTGQSIWVKNISGKGDKRISGMAVSQAGDIYFAGAFKETLTLDKRTIVADGIEDAFIAKLNSKANLVWLNRLSSTRNVEVFDLALGTNAFAATGTFTGEFTLGDKVFTSTDKHFDSWVAAFDENGDIKWSTQPKGSFDEIPSVIAMDNSNNVIVSGSFKMNINFGPKQLTSAKDADVFLVKYNEEGDFEWAQQGIGSVRNDIASDMIVDNNGDVILLGSYKGSILFDDITVIGPSNVDGPTAESVYIIKCSTGGAVTKGRHIGSIDQVKFLVLHKSLQNNVLIAGNFDEFKEGPGGIEVHLGKISDSIYIWKASGENELFQNEKSAK